MPRTPQTIAAHLRLALAPAVAGLTPWLDGDQQRHTRTIVGCAAILDPLDLFAVATSLTEQRRQAVAGRPRGESSGRGGGVSSPTASVAEELDRIRMAGFLLAQAIDRLHPDPTWPSIESGWRAATSTATEHLARTIVAVREGDPDADLDDAVDCLSIATREVAKRYRLALTVRAWAPARVELAEIDPPDAVTEAARCSGWPLGVDREGRQVRCGNFRGAFPRRHPDTGAEQHSDLCDDCYRMLCPRCWSRIRRTPGAAECMACEIRARRARAA